MPDDERLLTRCMTINDVCKDLGLSRFTVYKLIRGGRLRTCKVGGARRIRQVELLRYLESQERMAAK